ncbi:hypothetical protein [Thalassotalea atypica]|uniref:hypothetical protein n=1 Tax=Thalassotalea atypica TaxID=2054316 RepID=UPI002573CC17|nr:hypothetical protein [Thalassotalea atypica]
MGIRIMDFIEKSNKVLLFIAAIIVIIAVGKSIISDFFRKDYSEPKVQVIDQSDADKEEQKPKLEKRYVGKIKDVHILEITSDKIIEEQSYSSNAEMMIVSSSLNLSSNAVNLMFTKAGEKNHLLFENNALIVEFSPIQLKETEYRNILSKNIYSVAKKDTNKDGFLNQNDKKELLVSEYDGSHLKSVMDNIEGYQIISNDMVLVYTKESSDTIYYTFNVLTSELTKLDTNL